MKIKQIILFTIISIGLFSCGEKPEEKDKVNAGAITDETKTIPVEVKVVKPENIEASVPFTGMLMPIRSVDIVSEVAGKVEKIYKNLGQIVTTSTVLAKIDDKVVYNQFQQAQAQLLSAQNNLKIAELNLDSDIILFDNNDISKLAYQNSVLGVKNAEANQLAAKANLSLMEKNYNNTRIKSPISGTISRKHIELGTMTTPGMPLYRVVDISSLKIEIGVSQDIINYVKVGSLVKVKISAIGNQSFTGKVHYLSPQADEQSGAFKAEIQIKNTPKMEIRAGMTAGVALNINNPVEQLSVPNYALVTKDGDQYIYKVKNNIAELFKIETGQTLGSQTIVNSGLAEGDTIVVVGMKILGEKTAVFVETVN